jgi:hypothetical protein
MWTRKILLTEINFYVIFEFIEGIWNVKKNHIPDFGFLRCWEMRVHYLLILESPMTIDKNPLVT